MAADALITLLTLAAVLGLLVFSRLAPDALLMAAVTVLLVTGVLAPGEALAGFSNSGLWTVAALYVVAAGLRETGAIQWVARGMLGQPATARRARLRMFVPGALLSAFLNNTTVVAMFIPAVQQWARKLRMAPSRLLLPLSYIAILGGTCTLIGTSTNLVVDGLIREQGHDGFALFELAWIGVPALLAGAAFLALFGDRLLPERGGLTERLDEVRRYSVDVRVLPESALPGRTVAEAGLRNLAHGYLAEISRRDRLLSAVGPDTVLEADDRLMFVGSPECARELRGIQGLRPADAAVDKLAIENHQRCLVEAVVGPGFPGLGQTIRELQFRTRYGAAILSVYRGGERPEGKIGDIRLRVGDTLLMETDQAFVEQYRFRRDFLLVSPLTDSAPPDFRRAPLALGILVLMAGTAALGLVSMLEAALVAAGAMLATRCLTVSRARSGPDLSVLVVIGASFALGAAMRTTGLAGDAAGLITDLAATPWLALALVYLCTVAFTELITNNAAAVLMFSVALATAEHLGVSPTPFVVAVMFAASASFLTPLGYQTNLMVMGPGGYRTTDYLRLGLPMMLIVGTISILLIPHVWSFQG